MTSSPKHLPASSSGATTFDPSTDPSLELAIVAARIADGKKGEHTLVFHVGGVLAITEYFVITSASNRRLVRSIVDDIEQGVREQLGRSPLRVEGVTEQQWVLMDYGDAVVHVFNDEVRAYYEIERLYRDVPRVSWADELDESADGEGDPEHDEGSAI